MQLALLLPMLATLSAGPVVPPPSGLEAAVVQDASDGSLDDVDLLTAALLAGGTEERDVATQRAHIRALLQPSIDRAKRKKGAAARGDALLKSLHETVFRRYSLSESSPWGVAQTGQFNCVSSAVLYLIAAQGLLDSP